MTLTDLTQKLMELYQVKENHELEVDIYTTEGCYEEITQIEILTDKHGKRIVLSMFGTPSHD